MCRLPLKAFPLTVTLCTALWLTGCVTESETDDTVVYNRIQTTKRGKAKKRKRPSPGDLLGVERALPPDG